MGQINEELIDAHNIAKNLIDTIVDEVMKTICKRAEPPCDSFESLKIQNFGDEENIVVCIKPEGLNLDEIKVQENEETANINDICYQNLQDVCNHSSTLSTQGEGDFQLPNIRESKAFYHFGTVGDQEYSDEAHDSYEAYLDSSQSSVHTSFTDELIAHLHSDINNLSFDNIYLSDSEVENKLQNKTSRYEEESLSQDREETKMQEDQFCQTNSIDTFTEDIETSNELKHSVKFSQINDILSQYFQLSDSFDKSENGEEREILSTSSEELVCTKRKKKNCVENFSQTNPFMNPFLCSNVHSTIALSPNSCEMLDTADDSRKITFADVQGNEENNEWIEANEVQIKITEPGCSKDFTQVDEQENDVDVVQTKQYWSNVGLITEHIVDRRYIGTVEAPGIESIKGVRRVKEQYATREPEEIIWVTEAEPLEGTASPISTQDLPKENEVNYLSFPSKTEGRKKKKTFISRLTKSISSIFKFNNKGLKE